MGTPVNAALVNFVGGELSPFMYARNDLEIYAKGLSWCQNFLILPEGGASYRPGNFAAGLTKNNGISRFIPFQFSAKDAVLIVASDKKFRFMRNDETILNAPKTITAITTANPAVFTSNSHDFNNGDEVFVDGIIGMEQLNKRSYLVANKAANTFELTDLFGNAISSVGSTYVSGGTASSVFELDTPYHEDDLYRIRAAQTGDVMSITCHNFETGAAYPIHDLTRRDFTDWTLEKPTLTSDPFEELDYAPSGITKANPAVVTAGIVLDDDPESASFNIAEDDVVYTTDIVGMTQLNGNFYKVKNINTGAGTFQLYNLDDTPLNSTGFGNFSSGGLYTTKKSPANVAFSADGRKVFSNTKQNPSGFWESNAPNGSDTQYDDFTTGSGDTQAVVFNFSPVDGQIDSIQEMTQFGRMFALLGDSSIRQVYGATPDQSPTPTKVNVDVTRQGAESVSPVVIGRDLLFVDANGQMVRGLKFNLAYDQFEATNYNLASEHLGTESKFKKLIHIKGVPEIVWILSEEGALLSFTFNAIENIAGWARHYVGGDGVVEDIVRIRKAGGVDQLWLIVKRTINGRLTRSIEYASPAPVFPLRRRFYTGRNNRESDTLRWQRASWERLKDCAFLDMAFTYDGRARGIAAGATITPSATTGTVTLTASASVFKTTDVGAEIWRVYDAKGNAGGVARIDEYVSGTVVNATMLINFESTAAVAAGDWAFAVKEVSGLHLFEGAEVAVQPDASAHPKRTVAGGKIDLQWHSSRVHVGFNYLGMLATQNLDFGGRIGTMQAKPRNIKRIKARMKDSVGGLYGTSEYRLQEMVFRRGQQIMQRIPPPFNGSIDLSLTDRWEEDTKQVVIVQEDPTPCTILALDIEMFGNEPL